MNLNDILCNNVKSFAKITNKISLRQGSVCRPRVVDELGKIILSLVRLDINTKLSGYLPWVKMIKLP